MLHDTFFAIFVLLVFKSLQTNFGHTFSARRQTTPLATCSVVCRDYRPEFSLKAARIRPDQGRGHQNGQNGWCRASCSGVFGGRCNHRIPSFQLHEDPRPGKTFPAAIDWSVSAINLMWNNSKTRCSGGDGDSP